MLTGGEDQRIGRAFDAVAKGHQAQAVYQFLEEYFNGRQAQLDRELFEASEEKWAEIVRTKREVHLFLRNLMQLMKTGAGAGQLLHPLMELQSE